MFLSFCLLVTFILGLSGCLGSYVPCEPCDQKALSMCPPVPVGCQLIKEPGCGCCLTCALSEGQACGVYTGTCTQGLRCLPRSGEEKPLHALLHGRGVCTNEKGYKPAHPPIGKTRTGRMTECTHATHARTHARAREIKMWPILENGTIQQRRAQVLLARVVENPHSHRTSLPPPE